LLQLLGGHHQHVGAVLGKRAPGDRAREDACEIEHAHATQRAIARREFLWRRIADPRDLYNRSIAKVASLRVPEPFLRRAHFAAAGARGGDRFLERVRIPGRYRSAYRFGRDVAAEDTANALAEVLEVEVWQHPAPVPRLPGLRHAAHARH